MTKNRTAKNMTKKRTSKKKNKEKSKSPISPLTKLILKYKKIPRKEDYQKIYDAILQYTYEFPVMVAYKNKDHGANFSIYISKKIDKMIEKFTFYGTSFEGYLYQTCKGQFLTYIKKYNDKEKVFKSYNTYYNYRLLELPLYTQENPYDEIAKHNKVDVSTRSTYAETHKKSYPNIQSIEDIITIFKNTHYFPTFCKRIWLYIMKHSAFLSDDRILEISPKINIDEQECIEALQKIEKERSHQKKRYKDLQQHYISLYAKVLEYSQYLFEHKEILSQEEQVSLEKKLTHYQQMYKKSLERFQNMSFCISNNKLSSLFNISKGSIDSSIFQLKKLCKRIII